MNPNSKSQNRNCWVQLLTIKILFPMMNPMLFFGLGNSEIFIIFLAMLLLFGGNKIPELMRGLGRGIREFNSARANVEDELKKGMTETEKK
jgi:sec-independent protein translocase protein TatA